MKTRLQIFALPFAVIMALIATVVSLLCVRSWLIGDVSGVSNESEQMSINSDAGIDDSDSLELVESIDVYSSSESVIRFLMKDVYTRSTVPVVARDFIEVCAAPGAGVVTEAVYLEPMVILSEQQSGWLKVKLPLQLGYEGYVERADVSELPGANIESLAIVVSPNTWAMHSESGDRIRLLPLGALLPVTNSIGSAYQVRLLEGSTWVQASEVTIITGNRPGITGDQIVKSARMMLGTPYLWGGTVPDHLDCSGFVHLVFRLNGLIVPRDCSMQFNGSSQSSFDLAGLSPGDLIYLATYKDEASHVGIYAGNDLVIHASSRKGVVEETIAESTFSRHRILGCLKLADFVQAQPPE